MWPISDFHNKDTEAASWFYLLGERYYQPDLARFLTRDPSGYAGGINVYGYAGNNPINHVDPSGLAPDWDDASRASDNLYTNSLTTRNPAGIKAAQQFLSFEMSFVPGLNAAQGLHQAVTGCDVITGQSLNGLQRGLGALAAAGPLLHGAAGIIGASGEILGDVGKSGQAAKYTRYGFEAETVESLAQQAAAAEAHPNFGIHGVSVWRNAVKEGATATREEIEAVFQLVKSGKHRDHFTIVLPKPLTPEAADAFNRLFKRIK